MLSEDLFRKIRRIEIKTRHLVADSFSGEYHAIFKGRGMAFDEVRPYQPGDEIRSIDWNVTARSGEPYVKRFVEERELTVMLLVDVSASMSTGSRARPLRELAAELAAVLAFSATSNNDRVGLILFADGVTSLIPPRKGRRHVLRLVRDMLIHPGGGAESELATALETLNHIRKRRCIAFLLSDFEGSAQPTPLRSLLRATRRRHDLIALELRDPFEEALPDTGIIWMQDAESGDRIPVDTRSAAVRQSLASVLADKRQATRRCFRDAGVDHIVVSTDGDYTPALTAFFERRAKRMASL